MATQKNYLVILNELKEKIKQARLKAVYAVNNQLLSMYWEIGSTILQQQKAEGWGTKVIDRLAVDLKMEFPDMKGWSVRNIKYMRAFAEAYPDFLIVQQAAAQLTRAQKVQQLAAQIPWSHHQVILDKFKSQEQRLFYIQKIIENGWSRNILLQQIESSLHNRQGKAISNFETTLPAMESDLVRESFKSPYVFDFLDMTEAMQERELEKALIQHLKKFMLELGSGFAYVGNQFNLVIANDDYFLDLLFYNYRLRCFVLFELKIGEFKPEYAGKLNFYINAVNDKIRGSEDKPTIGILLCKTSNKTVVKYSLQGITTPMGVAEYKTLPKEIKRELPAIETLEFELEKEIQLHKKPLDVKKDKLNELIADIKNEELKKTKDSKTVLELFQTTLLSLQEKLSAILTDVMELFIEAHISRTIDNDSNPFLTGVDVEKNLLEKNVQKVGIAVRLEGFKKAGTQTFSVYKDIEFYLEHYKYTVSYDRQNNKTLMEGLYHELPNEKQLTDLADRFAEAVIDEVNIKVQELKKDL